MIKCPNCHIGMISMGIVIGSIWYCNYCDYQEQICRVPDLPSKPLFYDYQGLHNYSTIATSATFTSGINSGLNYYVPIINHWEGEV
jgi:hypothetical protein